METLVNVTEQTNLSINAQNPLHSPYVTEFQQRQAEYIELLNKPNKTALDQFYIKRLGQRIQEFTQRIQTEQAAPKQVQLQDTSGIREVIKDTVPRATKQSKRPRMSDVYSQVETPPVRSVAIETEKPKPKPKKQKSPKFKPFTYSPPPTPPSPPPYRPPSGRVLRSTTRQDQSDRGKGHRLMYMPWLD